MSSDPRILLIQERLDNDLTLGESHFREFKSAVEGSERKRRRKVSLVAKDIGETGRCLQRKDTSTVPVASEQIQFERHEQLSREYDRQWIDGATMADLSQDVLARVAETVSPGLSLEKCLQSLGFAEFVAGSLRLRAATLLLFSSDIRKWHPRSEIRFLRIAGTELLTGVDYNVLQDETHSGNVLQLLSEGWEQIRQFLVQKRLTGGTFQVQAAYPEDVCREAFVNAVAHRDYSIEGRSIEILVFNDRLEIRNPGRLLSTVKLSELRKGAGVHDSRNTYIARVLRELGYMQEMGEGIRRIGALMNGHELAPAEIDSIDHSFSITFSQRNIFSPSEQTWLDAFGEFNLSREEKLIVLLGRGDKPISTSQIWETLDLVDTGGLQADHRIAPDQGPIVVPDHKKCCRKYCAPAGRFTSGGAKICHTNSGHRPERSTRSRRRPHFGPLTQVRNAHCERIREKLSDQNIYRGTVKIRQLLHWLELVDSGGKPTERLGGMRVGGEDPPGSPNISKPGVEAEPTHDFADPGEGHLRRQSRLRSHRERSPKCVERAGRVVSVTIPKDYLTGRSRGYAFVRMVDSATSLKTFAELNGQSFRNRPLKLGWSFRKEA